MFFSLRVQERKNLKVLRGRHSGIVDWHLGIQVGLSIAHRHRTHNSYVLRAHARTRSLSYRSQLAETASIYIRAGSLTQEPNSSHSLAPLGYPSDPKNHREPFLFPGASCLRPVLACRYPPPFLPPPSAVSSSAVAYRSSAVQKGPVVPGTKRRV